MKSILVRIIINVFIFLLILSPKQIISQQKEVGIRAGINQSREENTTLRLYEIYLLIDFSDNFLKEDGSTSIKIKLDNSFGLLQDDFTNSATVSVCPTITLNLLENNFSLTGSTGPGFMTKHKFNTLELGGSFYFKSYFGLLLSLTDNIGLSYMFEHISNAGIYKNNPGVNMHIVQISFIK